MNYMSAGTKDTRRTKESDMNVSVADIVADVRDYLIDEGVGLGDIVEYNEILDKVARLEYLLTDMEGDEDYD